MMAGCPSGLVLPLSAVGRAVVSHVTHRRCTPSRPTPLPARLPSCLPTCPCSCPFNPTKCVAEMGSLLLRRSGPQLAGTYLWIYAAVDMYSPFTKIQRATALRQLADALAAADRETVDQQLRLLQSTGAGAGATR